MPGAKIFYRIWLGGNHARWEGGAVLLAGAMVAALARRGARSGRTRIGSPTRNPDAVVADVDSPGVPRLRRASARRRGPRQSTSRRSRPQGRRHFIDSRLSPNDARSASSRRARGTPAGPGGGPDSSQRPDRDARARGKAGQDPRSVRHRDFRRALFARDSITSTATPVRDQGRSPQTYPATGDTATTRRQGSPRHLAGARGRQGREERRLPSYQAGWTSDCLMVRASTTCSPVIPRKASRKIRS
jgi:hypothetical protein